MSPVVEYIPDLEQEEETLITAKIDVALEKLRRRMEENKIVYLDKELNTYLTIKVESHLRS